MIRSFSVKGYKSLLDHTIELGRVNVLIGENGSGKTNLLEALAMASAALDNKLDNEGLFSKGVRVAKPSLTVSSFGGNKSPKEIQFSISFGEAQPVRVAVVPKGANGAGSAWSPRVNDAVMGIHDLVAFVIYNASTLALRGLTNVSKREPVGIYGEDLDVLLSSFKSRTFNDILRRAKVISWLDRIVLDPLDQLKHQGYKPGRSDSRLYFRDRYMQKKNNLFSVENANEGILHILFYLALFASDATPNVFGIDNIETALNPQLCRGLMTQIAELAKAHDKQALITTHNPAVLDGLNLHDDEQRLFVVSRNDDGHTVTNRIKLKPKPKDAEQRYKLSELWMRGLLGGIPEGF